MTVLVTGASGLVGSHVVAALRARGERVRALVRPESRAAVERLGAEAVPGDVTDPGAWRVAAQGGGIRGIVHAAAIVQRRATWEQYVAVNVEATRLAAQAARAAGARLVHISSVAVYGGSAAYPAGSERRTEEHPFQPIAAHDLYARSKRLAEEAVRDAGGEFAAAAIRPTVIYGERDRLFTPRVIRALQLPLQVQIGPGTNRLSCVYAGNVAAAALAALDAPLAGFRAYNVTGDAPPALSQREFFAAFAAALGRPFRPFRIPAPLAPLVLGLFTARRLARAGARFLAGDNPYVDDRSCAELGWRAAIPAREAIGRTVRWFLENEKPER